MPQAADVARASSPASVLKLSEAALGVMRGEHGGPKTGETDGASRGESVANLGAASAASAAVGAGLYDMHGGPASKPSEAPVEASAASGAEELSPEQQAEVEQLRERDTEVRTHEQAHAARGGSHAGAPQYEFETGPDGRRYAVEGSVSIDTGEVRGDPEATVRKMAVVRAAANAPAEPSGQDRAVAAQANRIEQDARAKMAVEARTESVDRDPYSDPANNPDGAVFGDPAEQSVGALEHAPSAAALEPARDAGVSERRTTDVGRPDASRPQDIEKDIDAGIRPVQEDAAKTLDEALGGTPPPGRLGHRVAAGLRAYRAQASG